MIDTHYKVLPNFYNVLCYVEAPYDGFKGDYEIPEISDLKILGSGSSRDTYAINDRYCLKIPNTKYGAENGIQANFTEFLIYRRFGKKLPLSPCKLYFVHNLPVLVMKRLELVDAHICPKPLSGFCDGYSQVGKNKAGKFLCYDYGYEFSWATRNMDAKALDLTTEEMKKILSRKPQLSKCPYMGLIGEYKALVI